MNIDAGIAKLDSILKELGYCSHSSYIQADQLREILLAMKPEPSSVSECKHEVTGVQINFTCPDCGIASPSNNIHKWSCKSKTKGTLPTSQGLSETADKEPMATYSEYGVEIGTPSPSSVSECKIPKEVADMWIEYFDSKRTWNNAELLMRGSLLNKPTSQGLSETAVKADYKPMHTYPNGWVKPSEAECQHEFGATGRSCNSSYRQCKKCLKIEQVGTPSPSQDKTEAECDHEWKIGDNLSYFCSKCGISNDKYKYTKPSDTITISRKVAEEWIKLCHTTGHYSDEQQLVDELRRALTKNSKR